MRLIETIKQNKYDTISIIGLAKNAGKTVTLNYLIEEANNFNIKIGITSTGRDGESTDLVTQTQKPSIFATEGMYVATAKKNADAFNRKDGNLGNHRNINSHGRSNHSKSQTKG